MLHKLNFNYNTSSQKFQESEAQKKNYEENKQTNKQNKKHKK